ncbi:MAG TPA: hypothetical protein VK509_13240 [Polyangiales bacterium]|nr:hypothetical protein [Polyangiales bacterium]
MSEAMAQLKEHAVLFWTQRGVDLAGFDRPQGSPTAELPILLRDKAGHSLAAFFIETRGETMQARCEMRGDPDWPEGTPWSWRGVRREQKSEPR